MSIEKFKVKAVRTIKSPSNEKITTYYVWVNFRDLPANISLEVNPRKPKMNTSVAKQLISAVTAADNLNFDLNNRGVVITAKDFKFDNVSGVVSLDLADDANLYGILDGGHTYTAIIENREKLNASINKFVKLEIVIGDALDVSGLADARNTSAQVSDIALFELDDKFDFIKNSIRNTPYKNDVAYKDNDNKSIRIGELIKLLFAFNIKRFPDDGTAPVSAYSGKAAVFRDYKKEFDESKKEKIPNIYEQLAPQLPKLIELYENIEKDVPKKYQEYKNENGKNGSFGKVRGVEGAGKFKSEFTKSEITYQVSIGFLLPIFGAFRALLKKNVDNNIEWHFDPLEIWEKAGLRLVQNTFDTDTNPQSVGKSKTLWQANYRIVDSVRKDLLLEKLLSSKND